MKIVFIAYDWPGYRGGPIVNVRRLLPELKKRGHEVHALIFFHKGYSSTAGYLSAHGVVTHTQAWQSYTEHHIDWILKRLISIQPDVFVPNLSVAGWYSARWARKAGIPTISALRSGDEYHRGMVDEFVCGDEEWAMSGLVCVSQLLYDQVSSRKPQYTKLRFIPSGVPLPEKIAKHDSGPLRIAYVGRLVQEAKRIFDLIDALVAVLKIVPDSNLTLFGHAPDKKIQDDIDKKILGSGFAGRIECAGSIPPEQLHSRLINYHVIVLLSDYEGTPGSVMDGMACGVVPVCLDIPGGVQELVLHENTGLLVQDRKLDFVNAMKRLSDDFILRRRLACNARIHIEKYYSLKITADKWEVFCNELLDGVSLKRLIHYPDGINLPPVRKYLSREDRRKPSFGRNIKNIFKKGM